MIITARDERERAGAGRAGGSDGGDERATILPSAPEPSFEALLRAIEVRRRSLRAAPTEPSMPAVQHSVVGPRSFTARVPGADEERRSSPTLPAIPAAISRPAAPTDFEGDRATPVTHGFMPDQPGRYRFMASSVRVCIGRREQGVEGKASSR